VSNFIFFLSFSGPQLALQALFKGATLGDGGRFGFRRLLPSDDVVEDVMEDNDDVIAVKDDVIDVKDEVIVVDDVSEVREGVLGAGRIHAPLF